VRWAGVWYIPMMVIMAGLTILAQAIITRAMLRRITITIRITTHQGITVDIILQQV